MPSEQGPLKKGQLLVLCSQKTWLPVKGFYSFEGGFGFQWYQISSFDYDNNHLFFFSKNILSGTTAWSGHNIVRYTETETCNDVNEVELPR